MPRGRCTQLLRRFIRQLERILRYLSLVRDLVEQPWKKSHRDYLKRVRTRRIEKGKEIPLPLSLLKNIDERRSVKIYSM